jgi:hypothetical protein
LADAPVATAPELPPQVIQDQKTKVVYYLESDRRHVAAISPEGKLLWCCEVIPTVYVKSMHIAKIGFIDDCISVTIWRSGYGGGRINKNTGIYSDSGIVL